MNYINKNFLQKEDGSVTVIVAFFLLIIFGFMALSIDRGSWLSEKRKYQNAVDSGALTAAVEIIKNGNSEEDARDAVITAIKQNGVQFDENSDILSIQRDGGNITVTLTKDTDNYFGTVVNGKRKTTITVDATAGTEQKIKKTEKTHTNLPINGAIEAGRNFTWSGSDEGPSITGNIEAGGDLTITSPVSQNGSISADGTLTVKPNGVMTINGSLMSGGSTNVTTPVTVNGNIESAKDVRWNTDGGKVKGDISSNDGAFLGHVDVGGSVESKGEIFFNQNASVGGDVRSNTKTTINGGASISVDGTFYQKGDILDYQKKNSTTSSGGNANFVDDTGKQEVGTVTHKNYVWKWDSLYTAKDKALEITPELYTSYVNERCSGLSYRACIQYYNGNIEFQSGADFQGFFDFCHEKAGVAKNMPTYIPGSMTVNMGAVEVPYNGCLIVENDITMNSQVRIHGTGACLMSMNGNITVGNWGKGTYLDGTVIVMNASKKLQLNNGGTIHGGVLSKGEIVMNGAWTIDASDNWKNTIPVTETTTDEDTVITNIRLVR